MDTFDEIFRAHYQQHFAGHDAGYEAEGYEAYAPAYHFGRVRAGDAHLAGRSFEDAREDLHALYALQHPGAAPSFRSVAAAVRCGFETAQAIGPVSKRRALQEGRTPLAALDRLQISAGEDEAASVAAGMVVEAPLNDLRIDEDFRTLSESFRTHYRETYASRGREYALFEPAYRFGFDLARTHGRRGTVYQDLEPQVKRMYLGHYPDSRYDEVEDAVRFAYETGVAHWKERA
jgi:hypothetical protein